MVLKERGENISAVASVTVGALSLSEGLGDSRQIALGVHESGNEREPGRVVQDGGKVLGVGTDVHSLVGQDLTDRPDTSSILEASPEVLSNVLDSVDTNTIDSVVLDKVTNPIVPELDNALIFGVDVRQRKVGVSEPALFNTCLVASRVRWGRIVRRVDEAFTMERGLRRERRRVDRRVRRRVRWSCKMIDDNIDHQVHVTFVQCVRERFQIGRGSKVFVQLSRVLSPVTSDDVSQKV